MYNIKSKIATEFISHDEILESLEYATSIKDSREEIEAILTKAAECKGLTHREAIALLECNEDDLIEKIYSLAAEIKHKYYGNRVVMFAPLYLSNYCINGCIYCPYNNQNKTISRKKLTQQEIKNEVIALQEMGHKRIALETGEHPKLCSIDYVLESIKTIYSTHYKNGVIRRVNVNIAATTVENYKKLKDAEIGTYILFQETYNKQNYEALHPTGPKSNYAYHTEAMDRAMEAGIDDVGLGVLFGLNSYKYDFVGLMMHSEHLEATFGFGAHTISVPRICAADGVDSDGFSNAISDDIFAKIVAIIRIAQPYVGIIISTRESQQVRERVLKLGVSQISGGSSTKVGGYATEKEANSAQFELSDTRTLDEIVGSLASSGYIPSFCTACYKEGRTGDRFHTLVRNGQIANCCTPNALITFKEYLEDYGSENSRKVGLKVIENSLQYIKSDKVRDIATSNLVDIEKGKRDFRF
ncbi:MAG: [FeFe] hydrogenase H-cluster radical SAM maturase HydG [Rikenellaceae bacterium]